MRSIQKEDIIIININAPNIGEHKYINEIITELKGGIDSNAIIVGDFNILLSSVGRLFKLN